MTSEPTRSETALFGTHVWYPQFPIRPYVVPAS
jgi:hypothetical protein